MYIHLQIMNFLAEILPTITWAIMVITLIFMFARDRYKRNIRLNIPPEEQTIDKFIFNAI